jgi:hypothetical protein
MRTLVLTVALLFATSAYAEQRSLSQTDKTEGVEAKSSQTKSNELSDKKSGKNPVAKKRESDEDKARRIAKRYGVTW